MDYSTLREEHAKDAPFMERRYDRPPPSFHVGRDIYTRYFLVVRSTNGDLCPFLGCSCSQQPRPGPWSLRSDSDLVLETQFLSVY